MPQRRNSSMVRAFSAVARGCPMLPSPCSTTVHATPRQPRSAASPSPTGPAPTISTGVCVTLFDAAAINYSHQPTNYAYLIRPPPEEARSAVSKDGAAPMLRDALLRNAPQHEGRDRSGREE